MTNKLRLRNEGLISLDADGKRIIAGQYPVEWTTASGKGVLWETGSENKLLWKPDDNCCCAAECGQCVDILPESITIDLGTTNWTSANQKFYYTTCESACEGLEGEFILSFLEGSAAFCSWRYTSPFCFTVYQDFFQRRELTFAHAIYAAIWYSGTWQWRVSFGWTETGVPNVGVNLWAAAGVLYEGPTTTTCIGSHTLDLVGAGLEFGPPSYLAGQPGEWDYKICVDDPPGSPDFKTNWTWPATIGLTA